MSKRFINGSDFTEMVFIGANNLQRHVDHVNALNVFPVPDGDTGTNMNLTMGAGVQELRGKPSDSLAKVTEVLSKGLLMGARGNSGVILSQLFRGFSRGVAGLEQVGTVQFAAALQQGVDTAYRAVVKPVEGTILTVAKEAAKHAVYYARRTQDMTELLEEVCGKANERSPEPRSCCLCSSRLAWWIQADRAWFTSMRVSCKGCARYQEVPAVQPLLCRMAALPAGQNRSGLQR